MLTAAPPLWEHTAAERTVLSRRDRVCRTSSFTFSLPKREANTTDSKRWRNLSTSATKRLTFSWQPTVKALSLSLCVSVGRCSPASSPPPLCQTPSLTPAVFGEMTAFACLMADVGFRCGSNLCGKQANLNYLQIKGYRQKVDFGSSLTVLTNRGTYAKKKSR